MLARLLVTTTYGSNDSRSMSVVMIDFDSEESADAVYDKLVSNSGSIREGCKRLIEKLY